MAADPGRLSGVNQHVETGEREERTHCGRFGAENVASFAAEIDGEFVGSNFATRWGSVGFFGPNTVDPKAQGRDMGKSLVEAVHKLVGQTLEIPSLVNKQHFLSAFYTSRHSG